MVQIRNVPDDIHRVMKARAAMAGLSLSEYLRRQVCQTASQPTVEEVMARIESRPRLNLPISAAEIIREERDSR